jgi:hypothetical protein
VAAIREATDEVVGPRTRVPRDDRCGEEDLHERSTSDLWGPVSRNARARYPSRARAMHRPDPWTWPAFGLGHAGFGIGRSGEVRGPTRARSATGRAQG